MCKNKLCYAMQLKQQKIQQCAANIVQKSPNFVSRNDL